MIGIATALDIIFNILYINLTILTTKFIDENE